MITKSTLTSQESAYRLKHFVPGEHCPHAMLKPPEVSVYFTQINKEGLEEFHSYSKNERLFEFFEFKASKDLADTEAYYKKMEKRVNVDKTHYHWFVRLKENDKLIGLATLASINFQRDSVEWGQGIDPGYWGHNYNLEINELLKHFIFDVLKMNRLFGQTMVTNERAIAGVKAAGCSFEGVLRQYYKKEGKYIDAWSYSLLANEYFDQNFVPNKKNIVITIEDIVELISSTLETNEITAETTMSNCLSWDSLSHASIIIALVSKFNIKVSPIEYSKLSSVKLIHEYLLR